MTEVTHAAVTAEHFTCEGISEKLCRVVEMCEHALSGVIQGCGITRITLRQLMTMRYLIQSPQEI